jgi:hypothetical protein
MFCLLQQAPCHLVREYSDELSIFATSCKVLGSQVLEILGLWILDITELYKQLMFDLEDSSIDSVPLSYHHGSAWCVNAQQLLFVSQLCKVLTLRHGNVVTLVKGL